jgi:predicted amino acid dehydrogenase
MRGERSKRSRVALCGLVGEEAVSVARWAGGQDAKTRVLVYERGASASD